MVTKMSIKGNTESNPRIVVSTHLHGGIYNLGDGCHWSTKLNDTSKEAQVIPSESHNLCEASPWDMTTKRDCHVKSQRGWNFWWLYFSSNVHQSALLFTH